MQEGLLLYEYVLMILGIVFFVALLFILIYLVLKKQPVKTVSTLFVFPIVMIGWSSIQKVSFGKGLMDIEKRREHVEANPGDAEARVELEERLEKIEGRHVSNPANMVKIAAARVAVGDTALAYLLLKDAVKKKPDYTLAKDRLRAIDTPQIRRRSETIEIRDFHPN